MTQFMVYENNFSSIQPEQNTIFNIIWALRKNVFGVSDQPQKEPAQSQKPSVAWIFI